MNKVLRQTSISWPLYNVDLLISPSMEPSTLVCPVKGSFLPFSVCYDKKVQNSYYGKNSSLKEAFLGIVNDFKQKKAFSPIIGCAINDKSMTDLCQFHICLRTACQLPANCLIAAWQLPDNCLMGGYVGWPLCYGRYATTDMLWQLC